MTRRTEVPAATGTFQPHPRNAPGDFYCAQDVCLSCGAMEHQAPDLIGSDDKEYGCFVKKQPANPDELYLMLRAMSVNDVEGLRYRGNDPELMRRITEAGMAGCCDRPCGKLAATAARTRARITFDQPASDRLRRVVDSLYESVASTNVPGGDLDREPRVATVVAARSQSEKPAPIPSLKQLDHRSFRLDLRPFPAASTTTVTVREAAQGALDLAITAAGFHEQLRAAVLMDDVLRKSADVRSIRWYTESEWGDDLRGGIDFPY